MKLNFISAPPGSGKTHAASLKAIEKALDDEYVAFIVPSIALAEEVEQRIKETNSDVFVKRIDTSTVQGSVTKNLVEFITNRPPCGCILIFTQQAYLRLPYFNRKDDWTCYHDEVLQVIEDISLNISSSVVEGDFRFFDYFDLKECEDPAFHDMYECHVNPSRQGEVKQRAFNRRNDEIWNYVSDFCNRVLDNSHTIHVSKNDAERLAAGDIGNFTKLHAYSVLSNEYLAGFKEATVMSAFFEHTSFYNFFKDDIQFVSNKPLTKSLRQLNHSNRKIEIIYCCEGDIENWSKNLYNKNMDGVSIIDKCYDVVKKEFEDKEFCYLRNKNLPQIEGGEELPYSSHGLNKWDQYNDCAFLSAYNGDIQYIDYCSKYGLDKVISHDSNILIALQAINRISLRNPDSTEPVRIIVPTIKMANQIKHFYENAEIKQSEHGFAIPEEFIKGRGKRGRSANKLEKRLRDKINYNIRTNMIDLSMAIKEGLLQGDDLKTLREINYNKSLFRVEENKPMQDAERPLSETIDEHKVISLSIFTDLRRTHRIDEELNGPDELYTVLEHFSKQHLVRKEDNVLLSVASFNKKGVDKSKVSLKEWNSYECEGKKPVIYSKDNIDLLHFICLDFDGGNMTPEKFKQIFPNNFMILYSSYNNTVNGPPRFRVCMPITRPLLVSEYEIITAKIALIVENKCKDSGLDIGKLNAASLFYAPCIGKDPLASWIEKVEGESLDVDMMLKSKIGCKQIETPIYKEPAVNQEFISENEEEVIEHFLRGRHIDQLLNALQHKQGHLPGNFNITICRIAGKIKTAPQFVKDYFMNELLNRGACVNEVRDIWRRYAQSS